MPEIRSGASGNATSIKGKTVDDAAIGNNKVLTYLTASGKIEYTTPSGTGDMTKAVYDADLDNVVDNSEALSGNTLAQVRDHVPQAHGQASHTGTIGTWANVDKTVSSVADITTRSHADLTGVTSDQHHARSHDHSNALDGSPIALAGIPSTLTGKDADTVDTYHAASLEKTANKAAASGYCDLDASTKVPAARMPTGTIKTTLSFAVTGTLTTGTDKAPTIVAPCTLTITKAKVVVKTAPTGASIIVDVNKAGTTIFTTQANRPTIAISGTQADSGTPDVTSLAEGDKVTIDIDQIGSTIAGADLTVEVVCTQAVTFA